MIYRKQPAQPTTLLLRIVSTAGASVLLGAAACSSQAGFPGLTIAPASDSGTDASDAREGEADASPNDASATPCHPCGVVLMPEDAGGVLGVSINPNVDP